MGADLDGVGAGWERRKDGGMEEGVMGAGQAQVMRLVAVAGRVLILAGR